ncbi:MAG: membrane dipeptidase [Peptococcaceae bacterium]|nr:membrane dipeptidase [Peptococcaceae bacterium]
MDNIWIVDGHCDSLGDYINSKRDLMGKSGGGHWDLVRAREGKIGLQFFAAYIESDYKPYLAMQRGLEYIEAALRFVDQNLEQVFLVKTNADISHLAKTDKIGILLNIEGGEIIGESLFMLDIIYRLGVRSMGLTWNERNAIADGVGETNSKGGLSKFGHKVISKMNELGMLIDVSHINQAGFWDVVGQTSQPIVASHSCVKRICNHPRNLDDQQIKALADVKGVIGVNFCPEFLNETGQASTEDVIRHICYIAEIAGVDTVGIGSDFDGITSTPHGLEDVSKMGGLIEKLRAVGFDTAEIQKICYGNFVRLLKDVLK